MAKIASPTIYPTPQIVLIDASDECLFAWIKKLPSWQELVARMAHNLTPREEKGLARISASTSRCGRV